MRFTQAQNILDQVHEFHGKLSEYYDQLSDKAAQQRVKILLDYMSSHEKNRQAGLAAYKEDASWQVLNTWVDCSCCEEILVTCKQMLVMPEMSVDNVTKVFKDVGECLIRFYREVTRSVEREVVREVFRNLLAKEEAELRKLARNIQGVKDI